MFRRWVASLLFVIPALSSWSVGTELHVSDAIRTAMQDRSYDAAITAIDQALGQPDAPVEYLTYLKGRAYHYQEQYAEAVSTFEQFQAKYPESPWARRVRLAQAMSLSRMRGFRRGEELLRAEAEYLLSEDRKDELADIYLEFAKKFFAPTEKNTAPDYQQALPFFEQALGVGPRDAKRAHIILRMGQCYQELQQWDQAIEKFQTYLSSFATGEERIEARYRLAACQLGRGDAAGARRTWQDLLREHSGEDSPRLAEAQYRLADTYGLPNPGSRQDLDLGISALQTFLQKYPTHELASQAIIRMAQTFQVAGRHEDAVVTLKQLLDDARYQDRADIPEARFLLGVCYQQQRHFDEAIKTWQEFLTKHPAHDKWTQAQRAIVDTEYMMAEDKRLDEQYAAARELWTTFLAKYPLDDRAPQILLMMGEMNFAQKQWQAAIDDWQRLVSKYPGSEQASIAQLRIGATYEERLFEFNKAIEAYKALNWGSQQVQAQRALARLTAKTFSIRTSCVFRTDQSPYVTLQSRNIEKLDVRCYRVDLETYFRKMHLARGIEQLDISLIDPDETFEFTVPDYVAHKQTIHKIPIAAPGSAETHQGGVLIVTVSSDKQEATTMVLQSDLELIAKCSRDEVFVFTQNMRTGKPWGNARLLISNGSTIVTEATTGDDGVFQQLMPELSEAQDVRVFAIADNNTASNMIGIADLAPAQGLTPVGTIYTDRPTYRPGQTVHMRGIVRAVAEDTFQVEADKEFSLTITDARNRVVWTEQIKLNSFGTFHSHFALPRASSLGAYRIQITDKQQQTYEGAFDVQQYQLQNVFVEVDTPRKVYYRGEEIEGTIRVRYYFDAPVVNANVTYTLDGVRSYSAVTNDKGEIAFRLPTSDFQETQTLQLVVTLPDRGMTIAQPFVLAAQGFSMQVSTKRPVFLSGETFEIEVHAQDAEGKSVARDIVIKVLKQTQVRGQVGEVERFSQAYQTDEKDGRVRITQTLDEGGTYVVRAEGTDRFGNPVSGEHVVRISDDRDDVRLRILAENHTFRVGDEPKIRVHWRDEPALGLITYQGARVLGYQILELKTGTNDVPVAISNDLAPNFDLDISVMTNPAPAKKDSAEIATSEEENGEICGAGRLHTASSPFTVERHLNVAIARQGDNQGVLQPGSTVALEIRTTDPQGRPVSAELSIAMVEKALLDRFPVAIGDLKSIFQGATRLSSVRTSSSALFSYHSPTRNISADLLEESRRLEVAAAEAAALESTSNALGSLDEMSDLFGADGAMAGGAVNAPAAPGQEAWDASVEEAQNRFSYSAAPQQQSRPSRAAGRIDQQMQMMGDFDGQGLGQRALRDMAENARGAGPASQSGLQRENEGWDKQITSFDVNGDASLRISAGKDATVWYDVFQSANGREAASAWIVQSDSGVWEYVNTAKMNSEEVRALARRLAPVGGELMAATASHETGYWNPTVTTNEEGVATIQFDMPDRSTSWNILARGITQETLAGQASMDVTAQHGLSGELKLPLALTDGDKATLIATVHNREVKEGVIQVTLATTIGGQTQQQTKTLDAADSLASGSTTLEFPLQIRLPDGASHTDMDAEFVLTVSAGETKQSLPHVVPIVPYGMPVFATASGTSTGDTTAWVALPEGLPARAPTLRVLIGPTVEQSLLDVLFGAQLLCGTINQQLASASDTVSSDLLAGLGLMRMFRETRSSDSPQITAIDERIRSAISSLIASQNDDGGWSWTESGTSNRFATARCLWALGLAKQDGYQLPGDTTTRGVQFLQAQLTQTAADDFESKSVMLHALAVLGHDDFALANRLTRNRPTLSISAVLHLAMSLHEMDRDPMALELLQSVKDSDFQVAQPRRGNRLSPTPWSHAATELRALYAIALQQVQPASPQIAQQVDWLLEHRLGHRWSPDKATGPAVLAASHWFTQSRFTNEHYVLNVFVNGHSVGKVEVTDTSHTAELDIPVESLKANAKQEVRFELTGRGRYAYQCVLEGFVPADQLKSTTEDWRAHRHYLAAPLQRDGKDIARGFDVVNGSYTSYQNEITQLPVGQRAEIELHVWRNGITSNTTEDELEYLVVTEPLPAGVTVVESSVRGGFDRYEITPGAITFFVGSRSSIGTVHYEVFGYLPGEYRAAPTVVRDAYRPGQWFAYQPAALEVLTAGAKTKDEYRLTPRELYELGSWHFKRQEYTEAATHLDKLVQEWRLRPEIYKEATSMLLDARLAIGPAAAVVQHFEVIKEKWPELTIPYDKILKIGAAYHDMGEYERCYLIFRATIESSFLTESRVAGFLQSQGQVLRSVEYMTELLRQYPPEPYVAAATFDLAQQIYALAPQAANYPELREKKITRVDLLRRSARSLDDFLTAYPQDPAADQASFSMATALLELEQYQATIEHCLTAIARYPDSRDLDSFWYTLGFCHFALGQHAQALDVCQKVAEMRHPDANSGQLVPTSHHFHAIYILGQIYHSLGQAAEAIQKYEEVDDQFADAAEAIRYFTRRDIKLPEVLQVLPTGTEATASGESDASTEGDSAGKASIELPLEFRNVAECVVQVYRIDLLKFGLLRRDLEGIANINLAGIRPHYETTVKLGDGKDYRDRETKIELPLKDEGAYLVVCRADNLHASGMVLVSSLKLDVQEDATAGKVRVTVRDVRDQHYVSSVDLKIIGSRNDNFVTGESDLRGVFSTDGIRGESTVIAKAADGQYAFFRGTQELGPPPQQTPAAQAAEQQQAVPQEDATQEYGKKELLKGLMERNSIIQGDNYRRQQELYFNDAEGVSVEAVK
jgi:uncharacterized protein YfaS (alpha-2-macroglobulin family)/TolA-binding protein